MLAVPYYYPINTMIQKINASIYYNEIYTKAKIVNTMNLKKQQGIPWSDMLPRKSSHNTHNTLCKNHYFFPAIHCYKCILISSFILPCHAIPNIGSNSTNEPNLSSYKTKYLKSSMFSSSNKRGQYYIS